MKKLLFVFLALLPGLITSASDTGTNRPAARDIWIKEDAFQEMTEGGFGFHTIWFNIPRWVGNLDVDAVQEKSHLKK